MFHWDRGLFLSRPRLAIDVQRQQPHGFISHAHHDHMARHTRAYCTPETGMLYRHRLGSGRTVVELPWGKPYDFGDVRLTTHPAGHCLGSAMLLVEGLKTPEGEQSLLYTGDFKLGNSATAKKADPPTADVLLTECTFGDPRFALPPREQTIEELILLVKATIDRGQTPVVHAYELGKAQEVTRILTSCGVAVLQHPAIFAVSQVYQQCGVDLGAVQCFDSELLEGRAVVTLPKRSAGYRLAGIARPVSIAVTGWAMDERSAGRWEVDHVLPLSDHADFTELLELVERVNPRQVYCLHGPRLKEFVAHLCELGHDAHLAHDGFQRRLF
ncbi:MBL fold metallo-hydrolase [Adhaeretor mobilis]|uniref:Ribonuclease n=1 Tax=Adhaeretor mobilis TaxID=1930276 RepID=A0A517MRY1_9BACT|nr:MBL fold metallo-hydrolase [Adhaeretor mobilis]QDS97636.1 Ribonuclease [Adhaeretor mobilis]